MSQSADRFHDAAIVYHHILTDSQLNYTTQEIYTTTKPFYIDWGDGSQRESFTTDGAKTHTFSAAGEYDVQIISDNIVQLKNSPSLWRIDDFKFSIIKFDSTTLTNLYYAFYNCRGLIGDIPDLSKCTNLTMLNHAFWECKCLTGAIPDISKCIALMDIGYAFRLCVGLIGDIPDLSKCTMLTNSAFAFTNCSGLTGIIPDLTKCTQITHLTNMFSNCIGLTGANENLVRSAMSKSTQIATWPSLTSTLKFVLNCSDTICTLFPTSWGGTATQQE